MWLRQMSWVPQLVQRTECAPDLCKYLQQSLMYLPPPHTLHRPLFVVASCQISFFPWVFSRDCGFCIIYRPFAQTLALLHCIVNVIYYNFFSFFLSSPLYSFFSFLVDLYVPLM